MANSAGSVVGVRSFEYGEVKEVVFTLDTANSTISAAMGRTDAPAKFDHWFSGGAGTDAVKYKITYDTTNGEVDLIAEVEGSGTVADEVTVRCYWAAAADQDGTSISTDTDD